MRATVFGKAFGEAFSHLSHKVMVDLPMQRQLNRAKKLALGPLKDYYARGIPDLSRDYEAAEYVALDIETTGLDAQKDILLSLGYVGLDSQQIFLEQAVYNVVKPAPDHDNHDIGGMVIHQLFDDILAQGEALSEVMEAFLKAIYGKVLIAHHAKIERSFLSQICQKLYGAPLVVPYVDTLKLELRQRNRSLNPSPIREGDLRLDACRQRYHLPSYKAHHALNDALAAGELFLAQLQNLQHLQRSALQANPPKASGMRAASFHPKASVMQLLY
ncbi:MAG: exonuclease domain-containing protein [Deinococcales bacterium]